MKITLEPLPRRRGSKEAVVLVKKDNVFIGLIRKFDNTRTDTCPWQAFAPPGEHGVPNRLLGSFYKEQGYKKAAIKAVTDNNGTP